MKLWFLQGSLKIILDYVIVWSWCKEFLLEVITCTCSELCPYRSMSRMSWIVFLWSYWTVLSIILCWTILTLSLLMRNYSKTWGLINFFGIILTWAWKTIVSIFLFFKWSSQECFSQTFLLVFLSDLVGSWTRSKT